MATALIGLGSNLHDRAAALDAAVAKLIAQDGIGLIRRSAATEYPSVGGPPGQRAYLNAALLVRTDLAPHALLTAMSRVEQELGRTREVHWGPRTVDLDLLLYDNAIIETPSLVVPHPRLAVRGFVLEPAAEIAPEMVHPTVGWTIAQLLAHLRAHPRYVALAGPIGVGKTQLGRQIAAAVQQRFGIDCRSIEEPIDDEMLTRFYADPAGQGAETELEFLKLRSPLIADVGDSKQPDWTVSDFWFGQALAYGELWLNSEERAAQRRHYDALASSVTPPKVLVLLDVPPAEPRKRIAARGRPYELSLSEGVLDQLRENIRRVAAAEHAGPVLRLSALEPQRVVDEVAAAIAGMS